MPSTEKPLVVISGAAKGIGRACAEAFLATGWHVAALGYDAGSLSTFAAGKSNVSPIVTDVADPASVEAAPSQLTQPARALVNAAGIFPLSSLATADVTTYRRIFDINVLGTVLLSQAIARTMPAGGAIVHFASINVHGQAGPISLQRVQSCGCEPDAGYGCGSCRTSCTGQRCCARPRRYRRLACNTRTARENFRSDTARQNRVSLGDGCSGALAGRR
jgi:NAD(P)-dependent dehydrogenase (short-subunit alcohol dehydrogenase family)